MKIDQKDRDNITLAWAEFLAESNWERARFLRDVITTALEDPDPQPADDEIVKLAQYYAQTLKTWNFIDFARLIQAGIQKNKQGIEAVRNLAENNQHKIGVLESWIETIGIHSRQLGCLEESELGRKLGELEEILDEIPHGEPTEDLPQAKGGVACDKNGYPLIPGRSVVKTAWAQKLVLAVDGKLNFSCGITVNPNNPHEGSIQRKGQWIENDICTKLFDLSFPQDSGSSNGGES